MSEASDRAARLASKQTSHEAPVAVPLPKQLGLGGGGFVRATTAPIADLSANNLSVRDPALYYEDGMFWLWAAVTPAPASGTSTGDIHCWKGRDPTNLEYKGKVIDRSIVPNSALGGACGFIGPSGINKVGSTYHTFVVAISPDWSNFNKGVVAHLTAPSPDGPWTYAGVAVGPTGTETTASDNCQPVYFNGQWVMAWMAFDATKTAFTLRMATAPTIDGPWTRVATPTVRGGYLNRSVAPDIGQMQADSPTLVVDGAKLYLHVATIAWHTALYHVSVDLSKIDYVGPTMNVSGRQDAQLFDTGSSQLGASNLLRVGDELFMPFMACEGPYPGTNKMQKAYLAKWTPGKFWVPTPATLLALNVAIGNAGVVTVDVPDLVRYEAIALDCTLVVKETVTVAGGAKHALLNNGVASDSNVQTFAQVLNQKGSARGVVPLLPGGNPRKLSVMSQNGLTGTFDVTLNGYQRLP